MPNGQSATISSASVRQVALASVLKASSTSQAFVVSQSHVLHLLPLIITCEYGLVMRSITCVSVCLCLVSGWTLTFESLDLETSFLVCIYVFGTPRSRSSIKVTGSRSR